MGLHFTLDQLEVLEAIDRFGGFAAAAKRLHRATSAVSYAVKSLETAVGVTLFARTGRQAVLTPAGRAVLEAARDVLERSRRLERLGADLEGGWEPELRIVVDGVLPQEPIVRACQKFLARGISTRLLLSMESLSGVPRRFERDEAHLMLAVDLAGDPRLATQPLPPIEMLLVAERTHAVHRGKGTLDRATLSSFVEVLVADSGRRDAPPPARRAPPRPLRRREPLRPPAARRAPARRAARSGGARPAGRRAPRGERASLEKGRPLCRHHGQKRQRGLVRVGEDVVGARPVDG